MSKHTFDMILSYAQVFPENADMGDEKSTEAWLRKLAKEGGQTKVNAYFTSEEQIEQLVQAGFERMATNPKSGAEVDRIKDGNPDLGIGKYITLKRKINDKREYVGKDGELGELDFGGFPKIVDLRDMDNKRIWSLEDDGYLGDGTAAKVKFDMYKGTSLRLEAIGITELVSWEPEQERDDTFDVDGEAA